VLRLLQGVSKGVQLGLGWAQGQAHQNGIPLLGAAVQGLRGWRADRDAGCAVRDLVGCGSGGHAVLYKN
jgi:hypothetical protein